MPYLFFNAMKCLYVRFLGFSPSKQQSFFLKVSLNSCLIGLDQLYTGCTGGSSSEKALNKILSIVSQCVSRGVMVTKRPGVQEVPSSIPDRVCFFLLFFSFPLRLVFFLVMVNLFCFFI